MAPSAHDIGTARSCEYILLNPQGLNDISVKLSLRMRNFCFCYAGTPVQENLWSFPHCFHLGYFQTKNDVCKLFYPQSKKRLFCQNQQWVSKSSRFPRTQRLTQSRDSPSGSSKLGTSLSAFISGVWEPTAGWGGVGCLSVEE